MKKPYGFLYHGKIIRRWELPDGQAQVSEECPKPSPDSLGRIRDWKQVPLSMWDYSECEITEWQPIEEKKGG